MKPAEKAAGGGSKSQTVSVPNNPGGFWGSVANDLPGMGRFDAGRGGPNGGYVWTSNGPVWVDAEGNQVTQPWQSLQELPNGLPSPAQGVDGSSTAQDDVRNIAKEVMNRHFTPTDMSDYYNYVDNTLLPGLQQQYHDYLVNRLGLEDPNSTRNQLLLQSQGKGAVADAVNTQLQAGLNAINSQQIAAAAGARGGAGAHALALRNAQAQSAINGQNTANETANKMAQLSLAGQTSLGNWDTETEAGKLERYKPIYETQAGRASTTANTIAANASGQNDWNLRQPLVASQIYGVASGQQNADTNTGSLLLSKDAQDFNKGTGIFDRVVGGVGGGTTKGGILNLGKK